MRFVGFTVLAISPFVPLVVSIVLVALGVGFVGGIAYAIHEFRADDAVQMRRDFDELVRDLERGQR